MKNVNECPAHDNNLSATIKTISQLHAVELLEGTLHAGEDIEAGTLHESLDLADETLCAGEDIDEWTLHDKE